MNAGKTLFAQIMEFIPWTSFARIVTRYAGDAGVRRMNCAEQFRIMAFAQLTTRESLRDIEVTLSANASKLAERKSLSRAPAPNTAVVRAIPPPIVELPRRRL